MKKFKPSELPIDTVIDDQERGTFRKDAPGLWAALQYRDMSQQELVWDEGGELANRRIYGSNSVETPSDEYFKDFKVLAWPDSVVQWILRHMDDLMGTNETLERAIEEAEK